jgi:hypothetical protein
MKSTNADVICIQGIEIHQKNCDILETTPDWEAYLKINLGRDYPHMLFHDHKDESKPKAGGVQIKKCTVFYLLDCSDF